MTFLTAQAEVLKQDSRGRVRVLPERREALLDEFERSGASAVKFARLAGIKYPTFANWVQRRRKGRAGQGAKVCAPGVAGAGPVRLFEAIVEEPERSAGSGAAAVEGLRIELPGGSRLLIDSPLQLRLAAELVALIAQSARARC